MPRKNVSFDDPIEDRANWLIKQRGFSGLSNLLEVLIREEYERRHPGTIYPVGTAAAALNDAVNSGVLDNQGMAAERALVAEGKAAERAQQAKLTPAPGVGARRPRAVRGAKKK